ncbi:Serine/threonine protein kinase [Parasponia andersonii]|uniref:mitogen-activated protein kinase kinase kinase n=1 Tax=Parasponia andersonii TaxID=3476 RepID=A0A2P5ANI7_PARAD|nr:Serine/threonine protein kinase [Parasponia andersonii]
MPSSNSSSCVSNCKQSCGSTVNSSLSDPGERRLTRQRKLRYATDQDLGISRLNERSSRSSPSSPDSARKPARDDRHHWSFSVVPHPLPLPDSPVVRRPESAPDGFGPPFGRRNPDQGAVNSAKTPPSRCQRRFPQDSNGVSVSTSPVSPKRSNLGDTLFSSHVPSNGFLSTSSVICPERLTGRCILFSNFPNYSNSNKEPVKAEALDLRVNVPSKSAPASPRRSRAVERELQNIYPSGNSRTLSPVRILHSADHSPLNSPVKRNDNNTPQSPERISFPFQCCHRNKISAEACTERAESNSHVNAHPLPLPPGATLTSQPVNVHHNTDVSSSPSPSPSSSSMKGQWQKGKLIGRGTFGSVYLATNRETGALCAMKEVDVIPDDPKSAECIKQLQQEIKVLRQLNHPNIVQYHGSDIIDDHFYIYLEYVYPGSINKYVREHCGAITESVVRNFTRHIVSGLAYLHSTKTIHRDIKGANLLVDASGVVKLADFGMAKVLAGQSYDLSLKGSPYWMAPEVIKAVMQNNTNPALAYAVDIWSLGCTIIEMLNGRPPWSEFTGPQAMFKVLNRTPPIPETLSSEGKDFLNCCFRRNPADRPSAAMLLEHAFIRNSHDQNVSSAMRNLSAMNLRDKWHCHRDRGKHKIDFLSISPRTKTGMTSGSLPYSNHNHTSSSWTLTPYGAVTEFELPFTRGAIDRFFAGKQLTSLRSSYFGGQ